MGLVHKEAQFQWLPGDVCLLAVSAVFTTLPFIGNLTNGRICQQLHGGISLGLRCGEILWSEANLLKV